MSNAASSDQVAEVIDPAERRTETGPSAEAMEIARVVADTILYEGAPPRRQPEPEPPDDTMRMQFGVLMPPAFAGPEHGEFADSRGELVLDTHARSSVCVRLRFLHVQHLGVEVRTREHEYLEVPTLTVGDRDYSSWDEAIERQVTVEVSIPELLAGPIDVPFDCPVEDTVETIAGCQRKGRLRRRMERLRGELRISAERLIRPGQDVLAMDQPTGPDILLRIRIDTVNTTEWSAGPPDRVEALRRAMMSAHLIVTVDSGRFLSLLDPPAWAEQITRGCVGARMWPVLIGDPDDHHAMLVSPVILYDHPMRRSSPHAVPSPRDTTTEAADLEELIPDQPARDPEMTI